MSCSALRYVIFSKLQIVSRDETDDQRLSRSAAKPAPVETQPDINELMMQQYARLPPAHLLALMQMSGMNQVLLHVNGI